MALIQEMYTFTIEISMCIEIIGDVYRDVRISVGTPIGGLNNHINKNTMQVVYMYVGLLHLSFRHKYIA